MLLAAGFAPRYSHRPLDDDAMRAVRASLQRMLDAHHPYPGVVIDRQWNVLLANASAVELVRDLPAYVVQPQLNVFRVCLHPEGLAPVTVNFVDWATYLLRQIRRSREATGDEGLAAIEAEVLSYPNIADLPGADDIGEWDDPPLLVPITLRHGDVDLSMFTTLTTFGTPRDVTLDEMSVELFFPADDTSEARLRGATP